jgi:hypothetical protein
LILPVIFTQQRGWKPANICIRLTHLKRLPYMLGMEMILAGGPRVIAIAVDAEKQRLAVLMILFNF